MADTIVLMEKGEIQQVGAPEEIYHEPNNVFAAQFIGTPPMNILDMGNGYKLGFRPEKVVLGVQANPDLPLRRRGRIVTREMLGSETQYKLVLNDGTTIMVKIGDETFQENQPVWLMLKRADLHFFESGSGKHVGHGGPDEMIRIVGGMNDE